MIVSCCMLADASAARCRALSKPHYRRCGLTVKRAAGQRVGDVRDAQAQAVLVAQMREVLDKHPLPLDRQHD
jgi:hypothetical protein